MCLYRFIRFSELQKSVFYYRERDLEDDLACMVLSAIIGDKQNKTWLKKAGTDSYE